MADYWMTAKGDMLRFFEIEDRHLQYILRSVEGGAAPCDADTKEKIIAEMTRRGLERVAPYRNETEAECAAIVTVLRGKWPRLSERERLVLMRNLAKFVGDEAGSRDGYAALMEWRPRGMSETSARELLNESCDPERKLLI